MEAITRRKFFRTAAAFGGGAVLPTRAQTVAEQAAVAEALSEKDLLRAGSEMIFILLYPGFTALDAIGPEYALSCMVGASVKFIAKTKDPVPAESGFLVTPHLSFDELPAKPTLFLVPGGTQGVAQTLEDAETLSFIHKAGSAAELTASVCTGSLLLGAAGLLDGYEAASHWQTLELLPLFGAKPRRDRVVFDRNRATAAGVTAGLDFSLELVRRYRGDGYAKGVQLLGQYDPNPPFPGGGDPERADQRMVLFLDAMHKPFVESLADKIRATVGGK